MNNIELFETKITEIFKDEYLINCIQHYTFTPSILIVLEPKIFIDGKTKIISFSLLEKLSRISSQDIVITENNHTGYKYYHLTISGSKVEE